MNDNLYRREYEGARSRRASAAAELGANVSWQDGEAVEAHTASQSYSGLDRLNVCGWRLERSNSATQNSHQRHMPMEPLKLPIPRKTKEKKGLQHVSTESREYEDLMTILTSSYLDTGSAGCFTYSNTRLINSELLEKEFVEKRREMKSDGRTDKELEESNCFLLSDEAKLPCLCEKGLFVGHSRITTLGNPSKGVYLSRYSDLLQVDSLKPGATGEIVIFKVMKGKVKSIYENMKNLLDPTPRFDSHISKNSSKVTSLTSYRAFELTQQYFYEYIYAEVQLRPRHVCPYAVVSFQFKGKDSALPSTPIAHVRLNSQSAEGSKERAQLTVWSGDLVKDGKVLFQISLCSSSPPFLPYKLPEKLEIGWVMRLNQVTKLLPADLFSYKLYNNSQEVEKNGHYCSLLGVTDRNRSTTSVTKLLQGLEIKRVVLVTPLKDRGFLFLLSNVQMTTPTERDENWRRCLQALFVFPESREVVKSTIRCASTSHASDSVMPHLNQFIPALHHALIKARANCPDELSAGVERQAQEYLMGLKDGTVQQYPMGDFESKLNERGKIFQQRANMDGYLRSYLSSPVFYMLSVGRARHMVETHCQPEEPLKLQRMIDLVLTCKRNAENEVKKEEAAAVGGVMASGRKRHLEQETAERALKYLKASQEPGTHCKNPVKGNQLSTVPGSPLSVFGSLGLKDFELNQNGSDLAAKLHGLLTGLSQAAAGITNERFCEKQEEAQRETCPFDRLATKLGLPTNCDIDLRKQEELEEQMTGSISSLEGFSPSSHSGETNHHGAAGRGGVWLGRRERGCEEKDEEWQIPWVLIPITGLSSERKAFRDRSAPQDPRYHHLTTTTSITTTTKPSRKSPTPSPGPSPPPSPLRCPSPELGSPPSPFLCSSPEPSPTAASSQCPSPDPSPPPSPSQCPSPEPSPSVSQFQCPSPEPSPPQSPLSHCSSLEPSRPASPSQCLSSQLCQFPESTKLSPFMKDQCGANEDVLALATSREFSGVSKFQEKSRPWHEKKNEELSISASIQPLVPPAAERTKSSRPPTARERENAEEIMGEVKEITARPIEEETEAQVFEQVQEEASEIGQLKEVMKIKHVVLCDKDQEGESKELMGSSSFSPPASSPPYQTGRHIDSIVEKHLGSFSSELQLVLQEESICYNYPQSAQVVSSSITEATAFQRTLRHPSISKFSQYVSFFNPCPPVQNYVGSLQGSIDNMLTELVDDWSNQRPATDLTNADVTLSSNVSAFVSRIRAANNRTSSSGGELIAGDIDTSVLHSSEPSIGEKVWQPHKAEQFSDAADKESPPSPPVSVSASGTVYKPSNVLVYQPSPSMASPSHWAPQQSQTLDISHIRQKHNDTITRTTVQGGGSPGGRNCEVVLPEVRGESNPLKLSNPSEPPSNLTHESYIGHSPPVTSLTSLISKLQPEVFNNLMDIMKDVKRNFVQFYFHSCEPGDQVYEEVKEHLLKQGNVEQNPVTFLNEENADSKLLVIIKNKEISRNVQTIPGLVSLKRHPNVVFVGIDTLDDIRNNSYNEVFVSGGCVISDELVLNPDFITHDQLTALLMLLEQHSSPESCWRWKVHYKTHKKLKEQCRFRRDAAKLLEILSNYQKRQIVEFLPYHDCDMMNHHSPDVACLMELQARYTQYRHTVLLSEHHFEKFPIYSSRGIIMAGIEEFRRDFTRLVGYHDIKDNQANIDEILAPKEHIQSRSSLEQQQQPLQPSTHGLSTHSHLYDQLVPDPTSKESVVPHSGRDFEDLRMAIFQLRAERQAQQQQQQLLPLIHAVHTRSPLDQPGPSVLIQDSGKKAVVPTVDLIHKKMQLELEDEEEEKREVRVDERRSGGSAGGGVQESTDQGIDTPVILPLGDDLGSSNSSISASLSNQNAAAVMGLSNQRELTTGGREKADPQGEPSLTKAAEHNITSSRTAACPAESNAARGTQWHQDQLTTGEGAPSVHDVKNTVDNKETGSASIMDQEDKLNPAPQELHQIQQPQRHLQQLRQSHVQSASPFSLHHGASFLQSPNLPQLHGQAFSPGPLLAPMTTIGGSFLHPVPVWHGRLNPTGTAALVWGLQQTNMDFSGSGLLAGYYNLTGQSVNRNRRENGGGFNGM